VSLPIAQGFDLNFFTDFPGPACLPALTRY
jgi:hypothetical protein